VAAKRPINSHSNDADHHLSFPLYLLQWHLGLFEISTQYIQIKKKVKNVSQCVQCKYVNKCIHLCALSFSQTHVEVSISRLLVQCIIDKIASHSNGQPRAAAKLLYNEQAHFRREPVSFRRDFLLRPTTQSPINCWKGTVVASPVPKEFTCSFKKALNLLITLMYDVEKLFDIDGSAITYERA
jgi:hypothetical protein